MTDLGSITSFVIEHFRDCDALVLEFNHDPELLETGRYPYSVKRRVAGDWGHLNNQQSASLLAELNTERIQRLVVAHISEQNNRRDLAELALHSVFPDSSRVTWACQVAGFDWLSLD